MSDLKATDAKILSDNAVLQATLIATKAFTDATQAAIILAAEAGAYNLNVAVPGGLNLQTIILLFQGLGYTMEWLTNNTSLTLDWQNPSVPTIIVSSPSTNAIP